MEKNTMETLVTPRLEVVEVALGATVKGSYTLGQNNENIEKGKVIAIEVYSATEIAKTPTGNALAVLADLKKGYLTLFSKGEEKLANIPLHTLNPTLNSGRIRFFDELQLEMSKCKITFPDVAGLTGTTSVMLVFHFKKD